MLSAMPYGIREPDGRVPFSYQILVVAVYVCAIPECTPFFDGGVEDLVSCAKEHREFVILIQGFNITTYLEPFFITLDGAIKRRETHQSKTDRRNIVLANFSSWERHDALRCKIPMMLS